MGVVTSGLEYVGQFNVKISDGSKTYVDGAWRGIKGNLEERWDLDGESSQRDQPRFTRLVGDLGEHYLEVRNIEEDRGIILDLTQFSRDGGLMLDLQGQWYASPPKNPSYGFVPGTATVRSDVADPMCLSWEGSGVCERWESHTQVKKRIAQEYFGQSILINDGRWESVPWNAWVEAIR